MLDIHLHSTLPPPSLHSRYRGNFTLQKTDTQIHMSKIIDVKNVSTSVHTNYLKDCHQAQIFTANSTWRL
jgi:hypothetical protein